MNRQVTFRQITFMFLFISISPMLRQIPSALAGEAGRSGYLSTVWSIALIVPLTGIVIALLRAFPGLNLYEIMVQLVGTMMAKILVIGYLLWILLSIATKASMYSQTLKSTLMPQTKVDYFYLVLIFLVYYALAHGIKTVFRFSEFTLRLILLVILVLLICALPGLRKDYLLPVSTIHLPSTILATKNVLAIGGNIIIALFFADKYGISVSKYQMRKLWWAAGIFIVFTFLITVFTFGITGADLTAILPFPFYITVKSISFFNIFERFEVVVTLICVVSDFIAICIYGIILVQCFNWLFNLKEYTFLIVPLTILIFYLTYYISSTQFELAFFYRNVIIYLNLIFQYLLPILLAFIAFIKRKKIIKQF